MKKFFFLFLLLLLFIPYLHAQSGACVFKPPVITVHFGAGKNVPDINSGRLASYERVDYSCPPDGYYTFTNYTSNCFNGDWFTLTEDHTPGDVNGNFMLVNASYDVGPFFNTALSGLKSNTIYEFGVWIMNVCRISDQCPFPLLPNITIQLKTPGGKIVAQFNTGDIPRHEAPHWTQYRAVFTMPADETVLTIAMQDNAPGGCGNDFALDDLTFRECVKTPPVITLETKPTAPVKTPVPTVKTATKPPPQTPTPALVKKQTTINPVAREAKDTVVHANPVLKQKPVFPAPPPILISRANPLVKQIDTETDDIKIDVYDNGEIDGDTVTIYHNNELLIAHQRLSAKPISFHIKVDAAHPHHELIMVADNLGSIPPNTSLMIVTTKDKRYEVFISSTEQKNAKVVFDLKE